MGPRGRLAGQCGLGTERPAPPPRAVCVCVDLGRQQGARTAHRDTKLEEVTSSRHQFPALANLPVTERGQARDSFNVSDFACFLLCSFLWVTYNYSK